MKSMKEKIQGKDIQYSVSLRDIVNGVTTECFRISSWKNSIDGKEEAYKGFYQVEVISEDGTDTFLFDNNFSLIDTPYQKESTDMKLEDLYLFFFSGTKVPLHEFVYVLLGDYFLKPSDALPSLPEEIQEFKKGNFTKELLNIRTIQISIAFQPEEADEKPEELIRLSLFQYTDIHGNKNINPDVWQMVVKSENDEKTSWDYFNFDRNTKELIPGSERINTGDVKLIDFYSTLYDETLLLNKIMLPNFIRKLLVEYFEMNVKETSGTQ